MTNSVKKHIRKILFEESSSQKILYLHGLGATSDSDNVSILKKDYDIISPLLDYKNKLVWEYVNKVIITIKPIAIIGHSLGGYLAYYLSNKYKIPALMFNPAFGDKDLDLINIPEDIKNIIPFNEQVAIIGAKDDVVNPAEQIKMLEKGYCKIYVEDIGHDIPIDILYRYSRIFISKL